MPKTSKKEKQDHEPASLSRMSAAFKALSNETRLGVFEQIRLGHGQAVLDEKKGLPVCSVASNFNIALSTISHHIKELRNAGLIRCDRQGQTILWRPEEDTIRLMVEYLTGGAKK